MQDVEIPESLEGFRGTGQAIGDLAGGDIVVTIVIWVAIAIIAMIAGTIIIKILKALT